MRLAAIFVLLVSLASAQSTVLTGSSVLTGTTKLGLTYPVLSPGWTLGQDIFLNVTCGTTSCTSNQAFFPLPLTANSARILMVQCGGTGSGSQVDMTSATINGSSLTTSTSFEAYRANGDEILAAYGIGTGGTGAGNTPIVANMSGTCNNMFMELVELIPPSGYTASFGGFSAGPGSSSCTTCTAATVTTASTAAVVQFYLNEYLSATGWNTWSTPYVADTDGSGLYLNAPVGTIAAPTITMPSADPFVSAAMWFYSSAGVFTVPAPVFTLVNYVTSSVVCSPTCSVTVPSTTAGNEGMFWYLTTGASSSEPNLSSATIGASSLTVPGSHSATNCLSSPIQSGTNYFLVGCGHIESLPAAATTLSMTMSANATLTYGWWEVSRTTGTNTFAGAASGSAAASFEPQGIDISSITSGTNSAVWQCIVGVGGYGGTTFPTQQYTPTAGFQFVGGTVGGCSFNPNSTNGTAPYYVYQNDDASAIAAAALQ